MKKIIALTIAGSDPSGGAGAQADLKVFADNGVQGISAITAITAQNNSGVEAVLPVSPAMIKKQVEVLLKEFKPAAVKIGMTGGSAALPAITSMIKKYKLKNVVLDTVLRSTNNVALAGTSAKNQLIKTLPLVTLVTPNIPEAATLTGVVIHDIEGMKQAAVRLHELGARNVLVKGGHLSNDAIDILYDGEDFQLFKARRIKGKKEIFHGTGCILSSAIAAGLAKGLPLKRAIKEAKRYLGETIKNRQIIQYNNAH